jgi:hypothetical protein
MHYCLTFITIRGSDNFHFAVYTKCYSKWSRITSYPKQNKKLGEKKQRQRGKRQHEVNTEISTKHTVKFSLSSMCGLHNQVLSLYAFNIAFINIQFRLIWSYKSILEQLIWKSTIWSNYIAFCTTRVRTME